MASIGRIERTIKLSPREQRLASAMGARWWKTDDLCEIEFGIRSKWPLNARHIIGGALNSLRDKLSYNRSIIMIEKRGNGGRAGIEYRLSTNKDAR